MDCNNDGVNEASAQAGDYTCSYAAAGTYTVRIKDNTGLGTGFPRIYFNLAEICRNCSPSSSGARANGLRWPTHSSGCSNLAGQATDSPDLSGVTDMSYMFANATAFNQDIGAWNTANVTNMSDMFEGAIRFNQDIHGWDTTHVTNMRAMFGYAPAFNQNIDSWNTANVTDMGWMFRGAFALTRISAVGTPRM